MYVVAILGDLLGMIPIVNLVSDPITGLVLYLVGSASDINVFSDDNIGPTLATMVVKAVPLISIVPAWTIRVYFAKKKSQESAG